jgi:hypothetical protein
VKRRTLLLVRARYAFPRLTNWCECQYWYAWHLLARHGVIQMKEEGGYFAEARLSPVRWWFRGRAPYWGAR